MSVSVMAGPLPGSSVTGSPHRVVPRIDPDSRGDHPAAPLVADGIVIADENDLRMTASDRVDQPRSIAADLLQLTKPRIVTMILVTTAIAALVAAGGSLSPWLLVHLTLGVAWVAGSAGAMNQVWEYQIDGQMERTRRRPIAAGRIGFWAGFVFSLLIGSIGVAYLWTTLGAVPAICALATWLLYVPIYTPLKVRSEWNTTVGAISGALPMMIGYTAAGGSLADPIGWLLVGVLVAWQYPHFMAIAWLFRRQYDEAGFQMTTTVEPTGRRAGWQSIAGMVVLTGCLLSLVVLLAQSSLVAIVVMTTLMMVATYPMTAAAVRFASQRDDVSARKLLRASLLQLPASLLLITVTALIWGP